jgi:hypothetical protein
MLCYNNNALSEVHTGGYHLIASKSVCVYMPLDQLDYLLVQPFQ